MQTHGASRAMFAARNTDQPCLERLPGAVAAKTSFLWHVEDLACSPFGRRHALSYAAVLTAGSAGSAGPLRSSCCLPCCRTARALRRSRQGPGSATGSRCAASHRRRCRLSASAIAGASCCAMLESCGKDGCHQPYAMRRALTAAGAGSENTLLVSKDYIAKGINSRSIPASLSTSRPSASCRCLPCCPALHCSRRTWHLDSSLHSVWISCTGECKVLRLNRPHPLHPMSTSVSLSTPRFCCMSTVNSTVCSKPTLAHAGCRCTSVRLRCRFLCSRSSWTGQMSTCSGAPAVGVRGADALHNAGLSDRQVMTGQCRAQGVSATGRTQRIRRCRCEVAACRGAT